jgi:hypothetical protein
MRRNPPGWPPETAHTRPKISTVDRAYRQSTRVLGALLCAVGVVMVVATVTRGGGPLALGVVVGGLFAVLGAARVALAGGLRGTGERR